jgi:hypothetical protein
MLSALQLLAYLSRYLHVYQAFYQPRTSFHPATTMLRPQATPQQTFRPRDCCVERCHCEYGLFKAFVSCSGKEKASPAAAARSPTPDAVRQTNVFSLVEPLSQQSMTSSFRHSLLNINKAEAFQRPLSLSKVPTLLNVPGSVPSFLASRTIGSCCGSPAQSAPYTDLVTVLVGGGCSHRRQYMHTICSSWLVKGAQHGWRLLGQCAVRADACRLSSCPPSSWGSCVTPTNT